MDANTATPACFDDIPLDALDIIVRQSSDNDMKAIHVTNRRLSAAAAKTITRLDMKNKQHTVSVRKIADKYPNLSEIYLVCDEMSDPHCLAHMSKLTDLHISGCRVGAASRLYLPDTSNNSVITDVTDVTDPPDAVPNYTVVPYKQQQVTHMTFFKCSINLQGIHAYKHLTLLKLSNTNLSSTNDHQALSVAPIDLTALSHLPFLTHLSLLSPRTKIIRLTDDSLSSMRHLQNLVMAGVFVSDTGLANMASMDSLTSLQVCNCKSVTAEALCGLRNLKLFACPSTPLTTESFVAVGKLSSLETLCLTKCKLPPPQALSGIRHLDLKYIDLTECRGLTLEYAVVIKIMFPRSFIKLDFQDSFDAAIKDLLEVLGL